MIVCLGDMGSARSYLKPWENGNPPAQVSLREMAKSSSGLSVNVESMGKSVTKSETTCLQNLLPILATISSVSVYNRHPGICGCCIVGLVLSVRHNTSLLISAFLYICLWFLHSLVVQVNSQQHWMQQGSNILTECCVCSCIPHYI